MADKKPTATPASPAAPAGVVHTPSHGTTAAVGGPLCPPSFSDGQFSLQRVVDDCTAVASLVKAGSPLLTRAQTVRFLGTVAVAILFLLLAVVLALRKVCGLGAAKSAGAKPGRLVASKDKSDDDASGGIQMGEIVSASASLEAGSAPRASSRAPTTGLLTGATKPGVVAPLAGTAGALEAGGGGATDTEMSEAEYAANGGRRNVLLKRA